ncbi:DDT domain-containing protein DDR4-like [Apium graveolens]|uniref:DDT domain-containing protein DDR4-like n=1 Tax=Apium graveolens TaxID=4045 RepID=UPI003D799FDB
MSNKQQPSSPIHHNSQENKKDTNFTNNGDDNFVRRVRPSRACTLRSAAKLYEAKEASANERKKNNKRKEMSLSLEESPPPSPPQDQQCSKIVTPLVGEPTISQLPRWSIRSMWELASILNFLNVFRPILNIKAEFSIEELETALITPNNTLADIHIPLLKATPPIARLTLGQNTWVTALCRKLKHWWHWVADGELPIVSSHGFEVEAYNKLDPGVRVVILKALCDIRVEQEDIRSYIDNSIKHGVQLSAFRKERIGGDSRGISYWYEDDPVIGQRLYREIREIEVKKGKGKSVEPISSSCYQWETVATSLDEFQDVSEKLLASKNRTECSVGKKLCNDMLPEIEKVHKRKEKLLKKQHREALLLDNMMGVNGLAPGHSLRGRKRVSYTFDDYDRSINEAIKSTKTNQPSSENTVRREGLRHNSSSNGSSRLGQNHQRDSFSALSPKSPDYIESDYGDNSEPLDRSNRRRQRPQRYSEREFAKGVSDQEADFDSDYDIVGEVVYDEEYLRKRKDMKKMNSSSEGDEYWEGERAEEEVDEEDDEYLSLSEDSSEHPRLRKFRGRTRRETKLRSVNDIQPGLRRSRRATRNRIDYRRLDGSDSEYEFLEQEEVNAQDKHTYGFESAEFSLCARSVDSEQNDDDYQEMKREPLVEEKPEAVETEKLQVPTKAHGPDQDELEGVQKRRFLDLNELAPGPGFDDGPTSTMKDENTDNL